jgi:hypothetical protein
MTRSQMTRVAWTILLVAHLALGQSASKSKGDDPFFTGAPFSLNDLLQRVGVIADKRLSIAIERRGVSFAPTQGDYDKLKQAGASEELLLRIKVKAPPPKPSAVPPVKPAVAGVLTVQCLPAECDIAVNGKARGATTKGTLEVSGLAPGETVVDFKRTGFEGQQLSMTLRASAPSTHSVKLKPTATLQAALGKEWLGKMTEKLGGEAAFKQSAGLTATGTAILARSADQKTEWKILSRLKLPKMSYIELSGSGMKWWTSLSGSDVKADGSKQMRGGPVAAEMDTMARLYRDYQPQVLVERLQSMKVSVPSGVPETSGAWPLRAQDRDGALNLLLTPEGTPLQVVFEPAATSSLGIQVDYAEYGVIQKAWYPKSMTIKITGPTQRGIEMHFQQVRFEPKLSDRDLHR